MLELEPSPSGSKTCAMRVGNVSPNRALSDLFIKHLQVRDTGAAFATYVQAASFVIALAQINKFVLKQKTRDLTLAQAIGLHHDAISAHLLKLYEAYKAMCMGGHEKDYERVWTALKNDFEDQALQQSFALPDLYLDLKGNIQFGEASGEIGLAKVRGQDYFRRTQYFTEPYMSSFLMEASIKQLPSPITLNSLPSVVDPACGAGNTLISAFESIVSALQRDGSTDTSIADNVFGGLVGYDLDPIVANICKASLAVAYARLTKSVPGIAANVLTGTKQTGLGFFSPSVARKVRNAIQMDRCILITNPPFLGRRLMAPELKEYLKREYPEAHGDLCTAFIIKCANFLNDDDVMALVHQSTLWHLNSLSNARDSIQRTAPLQLTVKLGSKAFRHLAGEKASVSLSVFVKTKGDDFPEAHIYDFSHHDLQTKRLLIGRLEDECKATPTTTRVNFSSNVSKQWELPTSLALDHHSSHYGTWAVPMQGTSTGNSREAVRYSWEIPEKNSEWISVSKGGGYCRWWGLNRYVVLWGKAGEELRRYPGHALRNVTRMDDTALVFSDTGTLGLNVRLRCPGQVFIASGPGIRVSKGDALAHLAYLNSRFASLVLRKTNPKLTIAAGYIKKLPFNKALASYAENAQLAERCVLAKQAIASRKLSNDECNLATIFSKPLDDFDNYFRSELIGDLLKEERKLECESKIDKNVFKALGISGSALNEVVKQTGGSIMDLKKMAIAISPDLVDLYLKNTLSASCQHLGKSRPESKFGIDGPLEALSYMLSAHPQAVIDFIQNNIDSFKLTKTLFLNDLLHKAALFSLGFTHNRSWQEKEMDIQKACISISKLFPDVSTALQGTNGPEKDIDSWIRTALPKLHKESFFNRPFLVVTSSQVKLVRQPPSQ